MREHLFSPQRQHQSSAAAAVAMLAQINALPGTKLELAAVDGNRHAAAQERRFNVRRHVVGTFAGMHVREILRSDRVEAGLHIGSHVAVGIFVDGQRRRGVLDKNV